jgi:hypothetical protein
MEGSHSVNSCSKFVVTRPRQLDRLIQQDIEVVLSLERIEPLFELPLKVAAFRLGIGMTALKW